MSPVLETGIESGCGEGCELSRQLLCIGSNGKVPNEPADFVKRPEQELLTDMDGRLLSFFWHSNSEGKPHILLVLSMSS